MKRLLLIALVAISSLSLQAKNKKNSAPQVSDREFWCNTLYKMSAPVLSNMAEGKLQENFNLEVSPTWDGRNSKVAYMECFGRLMCGLAPWLSLPDDNSKEGQMRAELRAWALRSYANAVDPDSPDYLLWRQEGQTLVDAAFLAESFIRAWDALWEPLDATTKERYINEFQLIRRVDPVYSNWLLFSSTIESFLAKAGASFDLYRINSTVRKMEEWYVGDGWYSDGPGFAANYYNSYVIHPMYIETLKTCIEAGVRGSVNYKSFYDRALPRMQKLSITLERFISPEGTFPVFGRSIPYRTAAMQPLAMLAWYDQLPEDLSRGQVRAALTAVMHRMWDGDQNFDKDGYLTIGFNGSQPGTADVYTNNGSLYLTTTSFLPLGLPADHPFWTEPAQPWTQVKAWGGEAFPKDHVWNDKK